MTIEQADARSRPKPLRLWPGVVIVVLQWLARFVLPVAVPEATGYGALAGLAAGVAVVIWWAFFSRAPWLERLAAIGVMIVSVVATRPLLHESIATAGMGMAFPILVMPLLCLAFVVWAAAGRRLSTGPRRATMVAAIVLACLVWTLFRTHGISGDGAQDLGWRWAKSPEELFLAQASDEPEALPAVVTGVETAVEIGVAWPGFRGPDRDNVISGVRIETDWSQSPPAELWRRPIGPGWSSFAVSGDRLYTQEQRGDDEVVSCYSLTTGEPVWRHQDAARFWESHAGAGPRATPALSGGRLYSFGATGILNALDAADGSVVWSRDAAADTGREVPGWGFTSSPLVVDDLVIVDTGALIAYELATGEPRWTGPVTGVSYSSPHLATIDGVAQVLLLSGAGAISLAPADGTQLWEHSWEGGSIVQPGLTANGDILISAASMIGPIGIRRIAVSQGASGWTIDERWTSSGLKPYFSDFVVHDGHAYGFDGRILASIDLEDGERNWKGGRYGHGQLVLLADQDLLLVVSEKGEIALVAATPERFTELARLPAIEGKTWNHPVVVDDLLLVRNSDEMAAFRLSLAGG